MSGDFIHVRGARVHNLKNVEVRIPRNKLVVFTGPSGSGKSSLAFDTIYAEGQRRYLESLSSYARQFLQFFDKPDVDQIHVGLVHPLQKLAGVRGEALDVPPLPLGIQRVEGQAGLPRAADAGDDNQPLPGEVQRNVLEVVHPRAADDDGVVHLGSERGGMSEYKSYTKRGEKSTRHGADFFGMRRH